LNTFTVFGGGLRSAIAFPELASSKRGRVAWTLELGERAEVAEEGSLLGVLPDVPCRIELRRAGSDGFLLSHSCTGVFRVQGRGAEISFVSHANAPDDLIRADVLGRVLALAMHMRGALSLHASSVAMPEGAIAFLAPKGFGKSTVALSLARAGAKFLTDDILPVRAQEPFTVNPGVQSVRLCSDSALRLIDERSKTRPGIDGKHIVDRLPKHMVASAPARLIALYMLSPSPNGNGAPAVSRSRLSSRRAVLELLRHAKIGALLGGSEAPTVFQQAASIAAAVPAYELEIARDLHRLPDAVAMIASWHGGFFGPSR
jgi:hypothetical protein